MDILNSYFCNKCNMPYDVLEDNDKGICPHCNSEGEYLFSSNYNKETDSTDGNQFFLPNKNKPTPKPTPQTHPKPTITCPYCQSTDCKKISGMSRWASTGLFGLGSGLVGKQFKCNNCGGAF